MTARRQNEGGEQAAALAAVALVYHPSSKTVLRGSWQGFHVDEAREYELRRLLRIYGRVRCTRTSTAPWWRLWQATPTVILTPEVRS